jgi:hypothetical protein
MVTNCPSRDNPEKKTSILERPSASLDKGGVLIQHPKEIAAGFRINLLQKLYKKGGG